MATAVEDAEMLGVLNSGWIGLSVKSKGNRGFSTKCTIIEETDRGDGETSR